MRKELSLASFPLLFQLALVQQVRASATEKVVAWAPLAKLIQVVEPAPIQSLFAIRWNPGVSSVGFEFHKIPKKTAKNWLGIFGVVP